MPQILQGLTGSARAASAGQRGQAGNLADLLQFMQAQQASGEKTRQFDVGADIERQKQENAVEQADIEAILDLIGQFGEQPGVQRSLLGNIAEDIGIGQLPEEEAFMPKEKPKAGKVLDTDQGLFLLIDNELQPLQFEGERLTKTPKTTKKTTTGQLTPAKESDILKDLLKDPVAGGVNLADTTAAQQALDFIRRSVQPETASTQQKADSFHGAKTFKQAIQGIDKAEKDGQFTTEQAKAMRVKAKEFFGVR